MPTQPGQIAPHPPFNPDLTRRQLLKQALINSAGLYALDKIGIVHLPNPFDDGEGRDNGKDPGSVEFNEHYTSDFAASNPFEHAAAQKVAEDLAITSGAYYRLTTDAVEKVSDSGLFRTETKLAPIFFPEVMKHRTELEAAAHEHGVPVNVLSSLASIESAGIDSAYSPADAYGVLQVVPLYHFDKFTKYLPKGATYDDYEAAKRGEDSYVLLSDYKKVFENPKYNTLAGAEYFAECIDGARSHYSHLDDHDLRIYALAAAAYNGGIGGTGNGWDNMKLESQLYVNHVSRILLDVETSLRLRKDGYKDDDILEAMKSKHMDAMAYSYSKQSGSRGSIEDYDAQAKTISEIKDVKDAPAAMSSPYFYYLRDKSVQYYTPMAPGLRIWFDGGGMGLFKKSSANKAWGK